ncbi:MAG: ribonuclease J [Anaerolineales bacterium]|nr:ribonuclease J [Anaerolineales bacterium]
MTDKTLKIIPLGGLGEVGKNMMVLEYGRNILIVDTGLMFPESNMWGVDYIIPDFRYLDDRRDLVRGIVVTHGHEDHTGAIRHVAQHIDAPIYGTPLTCGLLEAKLRYAKLYKEGRLHVVNAGDMLSIGPFEVELFHVCHSIPDAVGLGITTPVGLVVHSGDFKLDQTPVDDWPTDFAKLGEFAGRGVLALLSDSTNADQPGWTRSESVVDDAFDEIFRESEGRILVATFASLISRIQQVINAANHHGRRVALVGTSMVVNSKMALKLGYLKDPDGVLLPLDQALGLPKNKVALMMTGSQGEPSSILGRLSVGRNRQFGLEEGDTVVVSAHPIPGNEEIVSRTINNLIRRGARVMYDPLLPVHVSGHAHAEEQKQLIRMVKPKFFVPVHGELKMLHAHSALAREVGVDSENIAVVENGTVLELTSDTLKVSGRVPGGYVYVDGAGVGDIGPQVLRERDRLASDGFVIVSLLVDAETRELVNSPKITSRGFVFVRDSAKLFHRAAEKATSVVEHSPNGKIGRRVEDQLSEFFYKETKRRPMVFALVNEV